MRFVVLEPQGTRPLNAKKITVKCQKIYGSAKKFTVQMPVFLRLKF